ncbi:unnamed protein product [Mytilus coruscus]|uniref:Uncharacterized protein n=1 Tax=Mytilus coruscus TaxID=42192 RepID=A0A6J8D6Y7_MYTCO|nr:unnamed protein product [Mytilus coruscus]
MTLRDSKDNKISKAGIQTCTGQKWLAKTAVDQTESILHHKDIVGNTYTGRQSLGMTHFQQWSKATPKEKCSMVQSEIREILIELKLSADEDRGLSTFDPPTGGFMKGRIICNNSRSQRKKDKQLPQRIARSTTKLFSHRSLQSIITNPATFNINFGGLLGIKEQTCNDSQRLKG